MPHVVDLRGADWHPRSGAPAHPLHGPTAIWPETNCALDLTIELLHLLDRTPEAGASCAFAADFLGDSWVTLKYSVEDLRVLHGVDIVEFSPYRPVLTHVIDHLRGGRLMTVEVDSWWLPDTRGTAYRSAHVKTSITPVRVDLAVHRLTYLHNAGTHELGGEDFAGVFSSDPAVTHVPLPYLEVITVHPPHGEEELRHAAAQALTRHLSRRATGDPVGRMADFLRSQADRIVGDDAAFHALAFTTTRQLGASAQLAAGFLRWFDAVGSRAAGTFESVARAAHRGQLQLARAGRGRALPDDFLTVAGEQWEHALDLAEGLALAP